MLDFSILSIKLYSAGDEKKVLSIPHVLCIEVESIDLKKVEKYKKAI